MNMSPTETAWHDQVLRQLAVNSPCVPATEPHLSAALAETLARPGRLVRARLILQAAERHGVSAAAAMQLACALEYWHQASLILDDLPCMDDAERRRGISCLHRTHGEATAILAALALVNRAYSLVQRAYQAESAEVRQTACELVDLALGTAGILCGQAWDLRFSGGRHSSHEVGRIAWRKTGALLWLALSLPLLPSGAWQRERKTLRALAVYWALAYQAMDDLLDVSAPAGSSGKTAARDAALRRPNLALALGVPSAARKVGRLISLAETRLQLLCQSDAKWTYLADWHEWIFMARYRRLVAA